MPDHEQQQIKREGGEDNYARSRRMIGKRQADDEVESRPETQGEAVFLCC
jgi:hypothetical protein